MPGRPANLDYGRAGALSVGASGGGLDVFSLVYYFFSISLSLGKGLGSGRVVRWCWANFQCRGVLQFGLQ